MPDMAKHVRVERYAGSVRLEIDGEEFPWHVNPDGVSTTVTRNGVPQVTLTIIADLVEVVDSLESDPDAG